MIRVFVVAFIILPLFGALASCSLLCAEEGKCEVPFIGFSIPLN